MLACLQKSAMYWFLIVNLAGKWVPLALNPDCICIGLFFHFACNLAS
jgi:hypothetical protein